MKTLVIYDITEDDTRNKIADICTAFGLTRIQKSAFIGHLTSSERKELLAKLKRASTGSKANIQLFTLCRYCSTQREIIGQIHQEGETCNVIIV